MRVYVIDDDPSFCRMAVRQLERLGHVTACYHDADTFVLAAPELEAGCVLLDIRLGSANGLALLNDLSRSYPEWPVVMVSGTTEVNDAIAAFRAGAIHLLRKPYQQHELVAALTEAAGILEHRRSTGERARQAAAIRLTGREREVLSALANGKLSKNIAFDLGISLRTVEMHRSNILTKVAARNSTQAIATCRSLGLI